MDRLLLILSTFCFLFGFAYTMYALGARVYHPSRLNFFAILAGFIFQTIWLMQRGQTLGRCPLTNFFEVLVFLSWSMVLFYLAIGTSYRLSLLGAFTSPLVFLFQVVALLAIKDVPSRLAGPPNPWLELHAAVSVIAYGAFALACVAGFMYLAQERQLKTHHIHSIFYHLPPIRDLATANGRLILAGFAFLTVGLFSGFAMENLAAHRGAIIWATCVWLLYGFIVAARSRHKLSGRRVALLSVAAFAAVLVTLAGLNFISETGSL
jgi:ABC-type uncharacterized transport system permease subunit